MKQFGRSGSKTRTRATKRDFGYRAEEDEEGEENVMDEEGRDEEGYEEEGFFRDNGSVDRRERGRTCEGREWKFAGRTRGSRRRFIPEDDDGTMTER